MSNKSIIVQLDQLSNYYKLANDRPRSYAFNIAARNIELINFDINKENIDSIDFKGIGSSSIEVIKEFVKTNNIIRLDELKKKYPPIQSLKLLDLYNFDVEYIKYLWDQYAVSNVPGLWQIKEKEVRVEKALTELGNLPVDFKKINPKRYNIIGDCIVQTSFGLGQMGLKDLCLEFAEYKYKHGFVADYFESPNVFGGITLSALKKQREAIRQSQIDHNIRIWQGVILDLDLDGNIKSLSEILNVVDFLILKISTEPHNKVISRLKTAVDSISNKKPILIDCLDKYCFKTLQIEHFRDFLDKNKVSLVISINDYIAATRIIEFLDGFFLKDVVLGTYAVTKEDLDDIDLLQGIAGELNLNEKDLINCRPSPWGERTELVTGIRKQSNTNKDNNPVSTINKLENILKKIGNIERSNSLGSLFKEKEGSNEK